MNLNKFARVRNQLNVKLQERWKIIMVCWNTKKLTKKLFESKTISKHTEEVKEAENIEELLRRTSNKKY